MIAVKQSMFFWMWCRHIHAGRSHVSEWTPRHPTDFLPLNVDPCRTLRGHTAVSLPVLGSGILQLSVGGRFGVSVGFVGSSRLQNLGKAMLLTASQIQAGSGRHEASSTRCDVFRPSQPQGFG